MTKVGHDLASIIAYALLVMVSGHTRPVQVLIRWSRVQHAVARATTS